MMKPVLIYIAGSFNAKERLKKEAERLLEDGRFVVTSTWLWEPEEINVKVRASQDKCQVLASNFLILDTADETTTGGREVEFGMALARGLQVIIIGPKRNIFHHHIGWEFDSWDDFAAHLPLTAFSQKAIEFRATIISTMW